MVIQTTVQSAGWKNQFLKTTTHQFLFKQLSNLRVGKNQFLKTTTYQFLFKQLSNLRVGKISLVFENNNISIFIQTTVQSAGWKISF